MSQAPTSIPAPGGRPCPPAGARTPPPKTVTYGELILHHHGILEERSRRENVPAETARQVKRNHTTAIKGWMGHKGVTQDSPVGPEFGDGFDAELERHAVYLSNKPHKRKGAVVKGLDPATIDNRRSILGHWRESWAECRPAEVSTETIPDVLARLVKNSGLRPGTFAKRAGVCPIRFRVWLIGKSTPSPHPSTLEAFGRIERYSGIEEGALTSLIKDTYRRSRRPPAQGPRTEFGLRQQRATAETYALKVFPPRLQSELDDWFPLMTSLLEPEGPIKRNSFWFVDPDTKECATADKVRATFEIFFGYLSLPVEGRKFTPHGGGKDPSKPAFTVVKGEGFDEGRLTLALLTDVPLVRRFLEFKRERAGGSYNRETLSFLVMCCGLLRAGTGFVRQHADYGRRLSPPVANSGWGEHCEFARQRYKSLIAEMKRNGLIKQTRDVEEPIDFIIHDPHPIDYLYELADRMEERLPGQTAMNHRARMFRDVFLVRFLTANPLRVKQFTLMTWRADNTGNLYREKDGSWWLRFPKEAFKNRRYLKGDKFNKKYLSPLPPSLWPYVETYLFEYRPLLIGADVCDYVFRPGLAGGTFKHTRGADKPMRRQSIYMVLRRRAQEHLRCTGFGPHAYRHIIATDYLKNHRGGVMIAASILHDSPVTILREYGHLQHADYFRNWLSYHEERLAASRARKTAKGGRR